MHRRGAGSLRHLSATISRKVSASWVKVAEGDLTVWVDDKMLKREGRDRRSVASYSKAKGYLEGILKGISENSASLLEASRALGNAADTTNGTHERSTERCKSGGGKFYGAVEEFREYFREYADHG